MSNSIEPPSHGEIVQTNCPEWTSFFPCSFKIVVPLTLSCLWDHPRLDICWRKWLFLPRERGRRSVAFAPCDRESSRWLLISSLDSSYREYPLAAGGQAVKSPTTTRSTRDRLANETSPPRCLAFDRILVVFLIVGTAAPCPTISSLSFAPGNFNLTVCFYCLRNLKESKNLKIK